MMGRVATPKRKAYVLLQTPNGDFWGIGAHCYYNKETANLAKDQLNNLTGVESFSQKWWIKEILIWDSEEGIPEECCDHYCHKVYGGIE